MKKMLCTGFSKTTGTSSASSSLAAVSSLSSTPMNNTVTNGVVPQKQSVSAKAVQPSKMAKDIVPAQQVSTKRDMYIKIFKQEFIRELLFIQDVANGRAKARDTFTTKLVELLKQAPKSIPIASDAIDKLAQVIEFAGNQTRDKMMGCLANLADELDLPRLEILLDVVAREVYRRYEFFIEQRLNNKAEDGVIPFAKVGVARCLEYIARKRSALTPSGWMREKLKPVLGDSKDAKDNKGELVEFSESFLLAGLVEGRSGAFVQGWTNNNVKLNRQAKNIFKQDITEEVAAEDVYARSAFMSFNIRNGNLQQQMYVRNTARHQEMKRWEEIKKFFGGETDSLFSFGLVKYRTEKGFNWDPLCGCAVMPLSVITDRYDYREQTVFSTEFKGEMQRQNLTTVQIDKETLKKYVIWYRANPKQTNNTVADYLRINNIWLGAKWVICSDDLSDVDLKGVNLSCMDFSGATLGGDLTGTNFSDSYLISTQFKKGAIVKQANFQRAHCAFMQADGVDFSGSDLTQTNFSYAKLIKAILTNCKMLGAAWHQANLKDTTSDVDLLKAQQVQLKQLQQDNEQQRTELRALQVQVVQQYAALQQLTVKVTQLIGMKEAAAQKSDDKAAMHAVKASQQIVTTLQETVSQLVEQQHGRESFERYCRMTVRDLQQQLQIAASQKEVTRLHLALQATQQHLQTLEQNTHETFSQVITTFTAQIHQLSHQYMDLAKQLAEIPIQFQQQLATLAQQQTQRCQAMEQQLQQLRKQWDEKFGHLTDRVSVLEEKVQQVFITDLQLKAHVQGTLKKRYLGYSEIKGMFGRPFQLESQYINLQMLYQAEGKADNKDEKSSKFQDARLSSYEDLFGNKKSIKPEDLFKTEKDKAPTFVLLQGRAGIGKTTFVHYAVREWAKGKLYSQHEWVFTLTLRELRNPTFKKLTQQKKSLALWQWLYQAQFKNSGLNENDFSLVWLKHIQSAIQQNKVLFILDGFDEVPEHHPCEQALTALLEGEYAAVPKLITSRPYGVSQLPKTRRDVEIVGFTDDNIQQYVKTFFQDEKEATLATKLVARLKNQPMLWGSAHIPVNLNLLCGITERSSQRSSKAVDGEFEQWQSMTSIYEAMESKLFERAYVERPNADHKLPETSRVRKIFLFEHYHIERELLAKLAFLGMQQQQIILPRRLIDDLLLERFKKASTSSISTGQKEDKHTIVMDDDTLMQSLRALGLIKPVIDAAHIPEVEQSYEFMHLTFQEYYAAVHIAESLQSKDASQRQAMETLILQEKYNPRWQIIWWFVAGLLREKPQVFAVYMALLQGHVPGIATDQPLSNDLLQHYELGLITRCIDEGDHPANTKYTDPIWRRVQGMIEKYYRLASHGWFVFDRHNEYFSEKPFESFFLSSLQLSSRLQQRQGEKDLYARIIFHAKKIKEDKDSKQTVSDTVFKFLKTVKIPSPKLLAWLVQGLNSSKTTDYLGIIERIGSIVAMPVILQCLLKLLDDDDRSVRQSVINVINNMGSAAATPEFLQGLFKLLANTNDNNREKIIHVAYVIKSLGSAAATPEFLAGLSNLLNDLVWVFMYRIYIDRATRATVAATSKFWESRLENSKTEVVKDSYFFWHVESIDHRAAVATLEFLQKFLEALIDEDVIAAPQVEVTPTILQLLPQVLGVNPHFLAHINRILRIGSTAATPELLQCLLRLLDSNDNQIRESVIHTIGSIGPAAVTAMPAILQRLLRLLGDGNHRIYCSIVYNIDKMGPSAATPEFIQGLLKLIDNENNEIRSHVINIIGHLGPAVVAVIPTILQRLLKLLDDNNNEIHRDIIDAIGHLGPTVVTSAVMQSLLKLLDDNVQDTRVRRSAMDVMGRLGPAVIVAMPAIPLYLLKPLNNWNDWDREHVINTIGYLGPTVATSAILQSLLKLLNSKNDDRHVCKSVIDAIVRLLPKSATPTMLEGLLAILNNNKRTFVVSIEFIAASFISVFQQRVDTATDASSILSLLTHLIPGAYLSGNISCQIIWQMQQKRYVMQGFVDKQAYQFVLTVLQAQACRRLIPAIIQQLVELGKIDIELLRADIKKWPALDQDPLLSDSRLSATPVLVMASTVVDNSPVFSTAAVPVLEAKQAIPVKADTHAVFSASNSGMTAAKKENSLPTEEKRRGDFLQRLKTLEETAKLPDIKLGTLNQQYQVLENEAVQLNCLEFYLSRGKFCDAAAQKEKNTLRQEALYNRVLQDYRRVLQADSFVEEIPERIEAIEALLKKKAALPTVFFSGVDVAVVANNPALAQQAGAVLAVTNPPSLAKS